MVRKLAGQFRQTALALSGPLTLLRCALRQADQQGCFGQDVYRNALTQGERLRVVGTKTLKRLEAAGRER